MSIASIGSFGGVSTLLSGIAQSSGDGAGGIADLFGPAVISDLGVAETATGAILDVRFGAPAQLPPAALEQQDQARRRKLIAAQTALLEKDYGKVRDVAGEMIRQNPRDAAANHLIARSYAGEGDPRKALEYYGRASELEPDNARYASDYRNAQILRHTDEAVIKTAQKMLHDPGQRAAALRLFSDVAARSERADNLLAMGDALYDVRARQQALGAYFASLEIADGKELEHVMERAQRLVSDAPNAPITHRFIGEVYLRQGKFDEAIASLTTARDLEPADPNFILALADGYAARGAKRLADGDLTGARNDYADAKALRPLYDEYNRGLADARIRLGGQWLVRGALSSALGELNSARATLPANAPELKRRLAGLYYSLGNRYAGQGDRLTAASAFQSAYDLNDSLTNKTGLAGARDALGLQYMDEGEYEDAVTAFQAAVDLFPNNETYAQHLADAQARLDE